MLRLKYLPGSTGPITTFHLRSLLKLPWVLRRTLRHLKHLEELPSTSGTFKDLPTLADLEVPVETPPHRTLELKAPKALKDLKGGEVPRGTGAELRQVYQQDLELER
jgi:hypothetical protein